MNAWHFRASIAVWVGCTFSTLLAAAPQDASKAALASDPQLRSVLLQARDAVVVESHSQNGYQTVIETDVKRVTRYLLLTDNRADVAYLQEHLGEYGERIRAALEPANTLADFTARAQVAEKETSPYLHDEAIALIVEQEQQRGFLEDALNKAKSMRVRFLQARCLGDVALIAFSQGQFKFAEQAVAAALESGKSDEPAADSFLDHQRMLLDLAHAWFAGGYRSAAFKARQAAKELLEKDTSTHQYAGYWGELGRAAAQQEDLNMAGETLDHLTEADWRARVLNEIKEAQSTIMSPEQSLQFAESLRDSESKFRLLRKIAHGQITNGDHAGAAHTLELAKMAAVEDEQFRVFRKADIAWEQIRMGDKAGAEATIADALKDNETPRWGSDQVNGWMMLAEALAAMGEYDRALAVAWKNDDPDSRARALQLVAYRETTAGHGDWAIAWSDAVKDPPGRARTLVGIAAGLVELITGHEEDIIEY